MCLLIFRISLRCSSCGPDTCMERDGCPFLRRFLSCRTWIESLKVAPSDLSPRGEFHAPRGASQASPDSPAYVSFRPVLIRSCPFSPEPFDCLVNLLCNARLAGVAVIFSFRCSWSAGPSALGRQLAGVDNPLQLVNRFASAEQRVDLAAEVLDGDGVAQAFATWGAARVFPRLRPRRSARKPSSPRMAAA